MIFEGWPRETKDDLIVNDEDVKTIDEIIFDDFKKHLYEEIGVDGNDTPTVKNGRQKRDKLDVEQAVRDYHNGVHEAFDYIYEHYRPILERLAYRKNDEDLAQELSIVLWRALQKFDVTFGVKFNTFFWTCARNHIGTKNIRRNAQKQSGRKRIVRKVINPETGVEEEVVEFTRINVVSLQSTIKSKDSETEIMNFIESKSDRNQYDEVDFRVSLDQLMKMKYLSIKERKAMEMIVNGATLAEIGQSLGGITAPAVHFMLRRLGRKKNLGDHLREILSNVP